MGERVSRSLLPQRAALYGIGMEEGNEPSEGTYRKENKEVKDLRQKKDVRKGRGEERGRKVRRKQRLLHCLKGGRRRSYYDRRSLKC